MHITIIGTGFVGVVSAAVFSSLGNTVVGLDIDEARIESLQAGKVPFFEPDLEKLLVSTQKKGKLTFTTSYEEAIPKADVIMIAVGTPSKKNGQADLRFVLGCVDSMTPYLKDQAIIAIKSTVPPGTCEIVAGHIDSLVKEQKLPHKKFSVVSLPEFLKEGTAVHDTLHPDRVLIGSTDPKATAVLKKLHAPLKAPILVMHPNSAQMSKYAANAYLATRITFINQIANLCEANGASVEEVIKAIGADSRIGDHYWYPGLGYGGSCFPKDVKELATYAKEIGQRNNLMVTIDSINEERVASMFAKFEARIGTWKKKKVAVLGLSFKPNTDDIRDAASTKVIPLLLEAGANVSAYDPQANAAARIWFEKMGLKENRHFSVEDEIQDVLHNADVIIVLVEWKKLTKLDLKKVSQLAKSEAYFIDTRNQYVKDKIESVGLHYIGVGV